MHSRLASSASVLLLLAGLAACGDEDGDRSADDPTTAASTPTEASPTEPSPTGTGPTETTGTTGTTTGEATGVTCDFAPAGPPARPVDPPPAEATYSGQVPAVLKTSIGDLEVTLDADKAPCTVTSFASLVEQGYYDDTSCHRQGNDPGFEFLQCGDPNFDPAAANPDPSVGSGGPGYTIPDELDGTETYPAGTLAMANTGQPDSGGGQFFIVFGDSGFPPAYTVWGTLDPASLKTLVEATSAGNDGYWPNGGGRPNTPITFNGIEVG